MPFFHLQAIIFDNDPRMNQELLHIMIKDLKLGVRSAVSLHSRNLYFAVPIAYSTQAAEPYDSLKNNAEQNGRSESRGHYMWFTVRLRICASYAYGTLEIELHIIYKNLGLCFLIMKWVYLM